MPDPFDEESRDDLGMLDAILKKIPGYAGYLDRDARRESDRLARNNIADHLERGKRALDKVTSRLVDDGAIDAIPKFDRLRGRFDLTVAQLRGAAAGYQNFFEIDEVKDDLLEDIYEHDLWTVDHAQAVADNIEAVVTSGQDANKILEDVSAQLTKIEEKMKQREQILSQAREMY